MKIFDMHCDTITTAMRENKPLYKNDLHIDFCRLSAFEKAFQIFAVWLEDKYYSNAFFETEKAINFFKAEFEKSKDMCPNLVPLLAVEGGEAIEKDFDNIERLKKMGICLITLCWNYKNALGCGALSGFEDGLSSFGKEAVQIMENVGIIADVSHLNEKGFWDLYNCTNGAFIASHSNAYSVCAHPRNLKDNQIKAIAERGGIIGLNIYPIFTSKGECTSENLLPHILHIMNKGGSDVLALGCDFDGISETPSDIRDISCMPAFYEKIALKFGSGIADKIFFENAFRFFGDKLGL